jgi:hypothetical protein
MEDVTKLFNFFEDKSVVEAVKNHINDEKFGRSERVKFINHVKTMGAKLYYEKYSFSPDIRSVDGELIQLWTAKKPEEISEFIVSGLGFTAQRQLFSP